MRRVIAMLVVGLAPGALVAQEANLETGTAHIAVETTTLVLDHERVRRLGLDGVVLSSGSGALGVHGRSPGTTRIGSRVGDLGVSAWLTLLRSKRAVRQESTQRTLALSGSVAQVASVRTDIGPYGYAASAGPELWVEPVALEDGRVRLRVWTAVGGFEDVPVEASTEIIVPSGTPVLIASTQQSEQRSHSGILGRASSAATSEAWVVLTARVVGDAAEAFPMPQR